jgi:hypothetical protein
MFAVYLEDKVFVFWEQINVFKSSSDPLLMDYKM